MVCYWKMTPKAKQSFEMTPEQNGRLTIPPPPPQVINDQPLSVLLSSSQLLQLALSIKQKADNLIKRPVISSSTVEAYGGLLLLFCELYQGSPENLQ